MTISPSKSRDLADENNKILTEWKWFETTVFWLPLWYHQTLLVSQCKAYVGYSVLLSRHCFMNVLYLLWCRWVTLYFGNPDFPPPDYCIRGKRLKKKYASYYYKIKLIIYCCPYRFNKTFCESIIKSIIQFWVGCVWFASPLNNSSVVFRRAVYSYV